MSKKRNFYEPPKGYEITEEDTGMYWMKETTEIKIGGIPVITQTECIVFTETDIRGNNTIFRVKKH